MDQLVADIVNQLAADLREDFDERAGIMEFDAGLPRAHAECLALLDVLQRHPAVLTGVTVLQVDLYGQTQWLLTSDIHYARQYLADNSGAEIAVLDLRDVINEQYGGVTLLTMIS